MQQLKPILLILLVVLPVLTVKTNHLIENENQDMFVAIINALLGENGLPVSKQIYNCFTTSDRIKLPGVIANLTNIGAEAGTVQLKKLGYTYITYTNSILPKQTLNCFYQTRDFQLLMLKYSTPFDKMAQVFSNYVPNNFISVHKSFGELKDQLTAEQYTTYGKSLNKMMNNYFGVRPIFQDAMTKTVNNLQNMKTSDYFGVAVSNGVIGAVSSIKPLNVATTVLAGAYDIFGRGRVDNIVQTFPALQLQVSYAGSDITNSPYNYQQTLNFGLGQFTGAFSSQKCSVSYSYWALKNLPFAFYTSIQLRAHSDAELVVKLKHQAPQYLNSIQKNYQNIDSHLMFSIMHTKATTKSGKLDLVIASSFMPQTNQTLAFIHEDWDSNTHLIKVKLNAKRGQIYKFGFISSLISSVHHQDPQNQAIRIVERAVSMGQQTLINSHRSYWKQLWKNDIVIQGHDQDQKNVRMMLYHCYAFINDWKSYGISPMGLSGLGYNGHVFWDMDLWIYPGVLALNPTLGKTLIQYRFQRLEAAKNNAFINGYRGAMYPWESSQAGVEQTPIWAMSGPLQHHISGCVAFATWNYFAVTQDLDWLKNKGFNIISAVAQFWESRVQLGDDGFYHIKNVVAADEWAQNVDDNAFTNAVAKQSLRLYNVAALRLNLTQNANYKSISDKIIILKMNNNTITREHSRYNGQNIKQADVNLLSYPLKTITDPSQILRDLQFYQSRIPNQGTPAMTYSIFTILYSRLKDQSNAYKYFKQSHRDYLRGPFNVFAETKWGTNPYFLTGAGGVIQSLVFGFGGYDITETGIKKIETVIPKEWKSVTIKGFINNLQ